MKRLFNKKSDKFNRLMLIAYCLVPISIFLLPIDLFDKDETIVCLSRLLFDMECWGCGLTRSVMHAMHGDFLLAYEYNHLITVVLPLLIAIWIKDVRVFWKRLQIQRNSSTSTTDGEV